MRDDRGRPRRGMCLKRRNDSHDACEWQLTWTYCVLARTEPSKPPRIQHLQHFLGAKLARHYRRRSHVLSPLATMPYPRGADTAQSTFSITSPARTARSPLLNSWSMRLRSHGGLACDFTISSAAGLTSITTLSSTRFTSCTNAVAQQDSGTARFRRDSLTSAAFIDKQSLGHGARQEIGSVDE